MTGACIGSCSQMVDQEAGTAGVIEVERTIRSARLTDRQALADLSRRVHASRDAHRRSLGVPAPTTEAHRISLSTLMPSWLPLRAPSVHLVAEVERRARRQLPRHRGAAPRGLGHHRARRRGRPDGRRDPLRPAERAGRGGRPPRRGALPRGVRRRAREPRALRAGRVHGVRPGGDLVAPRRSRSRARVAGCGRSARRDGRGKRGGGAADELARPPGRPGRRTPGTCSTCGATPRRRRSRASRATAPADWEEVGHEAIVPRSALNPILHFSEVNAWLLPTEQRAGGFAQHGACRERAALPALPRPRRRGRGRASCVRRWRASGSDAIGCGHPLSGANIRVGGHARRRGRPASSRSAA